MFGRLPWLSVSVWLVCGTISLQAQPAPLSLADCLQLAREHSPTAAAGNLSEIQARQARDAATRQLLPNVPALGGVTATDNVNYAPILDNPENAAVDVRFTGFPYSQAWALRHQRESELAAARFTHAEAEQETEL